MVDWSNLKKQDFSNTLNTLSMASPFSLEEKQVLLETKDLNTRKLRLEEILKTYTLDEFSNKTTIIKKRIYLHQLYFIKKLFINLFFF